MVWGGGWLGENLRVLDFAGGESQGWTDKPNHRIGYPSLRVNVNND